MNKTTFYPGHFKIIFGLLILGLVVWFMFFKLNYPGGFGPGDVLTYSMLARNIVEGNGIAHNTVKTVELAALGHFPVHDVQQPVFWPIVLSLSFFIFGVSDMVIALTSSFFYWLLIPLVYFLAWKMFDERVAILSTVIAILNFSLLKFSVSGLTELFFAALITLVFLLFYHSEKRKDFILPGLLLGIGYLTRSQTIFFIPGALLFIFLFRKDKRYQKLMVFMCAFFVVLVPFIVRSHIYSEGVDFSSGSAALLVDDGNPSERLDQIRSLTLKTDAASPLMYVIRHPLFLMNKFINNLFEFYNNIFSGLRSPFIIALFFAGTLTVSKATKTQEIKILLILLLISNVIGCSLAAPRPRYLLSLLPVMIIFATAFLISQYDRLNPGKRYKALFLVFLTLLLVLPLPGYFLKTSIARIQSGGGVDVFRYYFVKDMIGKNTSKDDVLITNNHSITGWYGDRKAVAFPLRVADIEIIDRKYVKVGAIFLESGDMAKWDPCEEWWNILKHKPETVLEKFKLASSFDDGVTQAVLYVRKP